MITEKLKISVSKELSEFILPLSSEELGLLEKSLINEGCRDPLIIWDKSNDQSILIDGHNRFKICKKNNIIFKVKKISFRSIDEVKIWMVDNQMGRRNLNPDQISYYRGLRYLALKKNKGGYEKVNAKGKLQITTAEVLSDRYSVSESTVKRDSKFAEGLNLIGQSNEKLKHKILTGEIKVKKSDVQTLANAKNKRTLVIRNEADLFNKAKIIRDDILEEVEHGIKKITQDKISHVQEFLHTKEPLFLGKDDRLKKLKGLIISAINRAINTKDTQAIKEIKKLIDQLADVIFD